MVNNNAIIKYTYSIEMTYVYPKNKTMEHIKFIPETIKSFTILHDYDENCMPIIISEIAVDKALLDVMIKNNDSSVFIISLYKTSNKSKLKEKSLCFRSRFVYFLNSDLNKNDYIEYNKFNKENRKENKNKNYINISIGFLCAEFINRNNVGMINGINVRNTNMKNIVLNVLKDMKPLVIGSFSSNDNLKQFILQPTDSINSTLKALNEYRVFFNSPYRFYQDWNATYLIASNGEAHKAPKEKYSSVIIRVSELVRDHKYSDGYIENRENKTYDIPIDITEMDIIDNTIINKQINQVYTYDDKSNSKNKLKNKSNNIKNGNTAKRIYNGNTGMIDNIKNDANNNNVFVYIAKSGLDIDIFTIGKKININHHTKNKKKDGRYLLTRKIEYFVREDGKSFNLITGLNLKKIG